jgi:hypothetical protein
VRVPIKMNAKKENLETKAKKAVLKIGDTVKNIEYVLRDLSMKLCYVIRNKGKDYTVTDGFDSNYDHYGRK